MYLLPTSMLRNELQAFTDFQMKHSAKFDFTATKLICDPKMSLATMVICG